MGKAWGGRLPGGTDRRVEEFTESIHVDHRLYLEDVEGSIAHATMLADVGLLNRAEADQIAQTLRTIATDIESGNFPFDIAREDIHLHIESALIEKLGDVGRKLHTARSRNDQVITDLKLWIRRHLDQVDGKLVNLQRALLNKATRYKDRILPAYTHLQRAQPVLAGHYFLAYVEKYERDRQRVADCRRRVNVLPLGAAAVAGTSLPIDRQRVAALLGFDGVCANSIDVVSDRDFVVETVFVMTLIAEHLSTWAEEWILWATTEFDFVRLPDAFCTGSSIMPHKKNPDVLELIRGKTARVIGSLQTLLVLLKGLPLAYNRDLQEDKPPLFDAVDTVSACLDLATALIDSAELNEDRIASRIEEGFLDATTLMERLIHHGVPMRTAHEAVGGLVRRCLDKQCGLAQLSNADFAEFSPVPAEQLRPALGTANALSAFTSLGSTAPDQVAAQLEHWQRRLAN